MIGRIWDRCIPGGIGHSTINIDMPWKRMGAFGVSLLANTGRYGDEDKILEKFQVSSRNGLVTLSVRSAFHLYLKVKNYRRGSKVLMSSVNIPDMVYILQEHGLVPIPIDFDLNTMMVDTESLQKHISDDDIAFVLIAHIYGKVADITEIAQICLEKRVSLLEDCAESFCGFEEHAGYLGHPSSDIVFFSFGVMKTSTSLGGGVVLVRNPQLCSSMRHEHSLLPVQPHSELVFKAMRYSLLMAFVKSPRLLSILNTKFEWLGYDLTDLGVQMLRGFKGPLFDQIEFRPHSLLVTNLLESLNSYTADSIDQCRSRGNLMKSLLPLNTAIPGTESSKQNYWLFPVIVENPKQLSQRLRKYGILAHCSSSQLALVRNDDLLTCESKFLMEHILYIPVHAGVSEYQLRKIADILEKCVNIPLPSRL